jgi:hypothetical protein
MIDISIVIVNWNTADLLKNCISSIINETNNCTFEIIVVDNGSIDNSCLLIEKNFPTVKIIKNERNEGFARANNIGMKECKGEYICLSNTDIIVMDNALLRMKTYLDKNSDIGVLLPKCYDGEMNISLCCRDFPTVRNLICEALYFDRIFPNIQFLRGRSKDLSFHKKNRSVETIPLCFTLFRAQSIKSMGYLDENFFFYGEDLDLCKRFKDLGMDVGYIADAKVIHFGGVSSKKQPYRFLKEKNRTMLMYWRKHHSYFEFKVTNLILFIHYFIRSVFIFAQKLFNNQNSFDNTKFTNYTKITKYLFKNLID